MMINIEGNPFRSVIGFKDAAGNTRAFLVKDFAEQSEHVTLEQNTGGSTSYVLAHPTAGCQGYGVFTGI